MTHGTAKRGIYFPIISVAVLGTQKELFEPFGALRPRITVLTAPINQPHGAAMRGGVL
jgi:hypothetical protein